MRITVEALAEEDDIRWAVNVAIYKMIYEEMKQPGLYNEARSEELLRACIKYGVALICKVDNVTVGILCGVVSEHPLNPSITLISELIWYILPTHRKSRVGLLLLKQYLNHAKEVADIGTFSLLPSSDIRSLERFGFRMVEKAYLVEFGGNVWQ